jgi:hypothetical protein
VLCCVMLYCVVAPSVLVFQLSTLESLLGPILLPPPKHHVVGTLRDSALDHHPSVIPKSSVCRPSCGLSSWRE